MRCASRLPVLLVVPLLALGACGDNRTSKSSRDEQTRSAKLVLPSTMTPPIHVGTISGAPGAWKLSQKVAWALRQRDIPATDGIRRESNYRLSGTLTRSGPGGGQMVIRWRLADPAGKKVGEVTQVAALPPGAGPNEDILESVADAAAESLSPIIPSSKLQTARRFDTGEPTSRPPKEADDKVRVTAVGKIKTDTPLSRNLLTPPKAAALPAPGGRTVARGTDGATGGTSTTSSNKSVTAIGRMGPGSSALSRNLIRTDDAPAKHKPATVANDRINTQSTTSSLPRARAADVETKGPSGSMTDLIRQYPTSLERRTGRTVGAKGGGVENDGAKDGGAKIIRVADSRPRAVPKTHIIPKAKVTGQTADAGNKSASRGASGRYLWWIQIGSYGSAAEGEGQWTRLRARAPGVLADRQHRVVRKNLGSKGVWYRLQVGPSGSKAEALKLCAELKSAGLGCFLVAERNPGETMPAAKPKTVAHPPAKSTPPGTDKGETSRKAETKPEAKPKDPPPGNGISVYDWKKPDKKPDPKDPPLSTRPGLPGLTN